MEREIKFRAWDKKSKTMFNIGFTITPSGSVNLSDYFWEDKNKVDLILMQYTGLKDKNGKEIYEGDIVNLGGDGSIFDEEGNWWGASGPAGYGNPIVVVEWDKEITGFTPFNNYDCDCEVYYKAEKMEVIGNIYENSNLLKNK